MTIIMSNSLKIWKEMLYESLHTFCSYSRRIKINYGIEIQYQKSIVKEW